MRQLGLSRPNWCLRSLYLPLGMLQKQIMPHTLICPLVDGSVISIPQSTSTLNSQQIFKGLWWFFLNLHTFNLGHAVIPQWIMWQRNVHVEIFQFHLLSPTSIPWYMGHAIQHELLPLIMRISFTGPAAMCLSDPILSLAIWNPFKCF